MRLTRGKRAPSNKSIGRWLHAAGFYEIRKNESFLNQGVRVHRAFCKLKNWK